MAIGLAAEGGTRNVQQEARATDWPLHRWITLERAPGAPRWGFFLRAETMHGYVTRQESFSIERDPVFHEMRHGEPFLELLRTLFDSPGLSCLDEPAAALSFSAQIDLARPRRRCRGPVRHPLAAARGPARSPVARDGSRGLRETAYEELELVGHWRRFLEAPMRYLHHVIDVD
ncbi:MAG: hypothetical protein QOF53_2477 [Nocardioidaceae bacterium]|nr:hypothetical protein [Nocardioidaceae bacterium]